MKERHMKTRLFTLFETISGIPHASYQEKALSDYIKEFSEALGLEVYQDQYNNLLVKKDATPGYEDAPVVMLQSHLDMVAEKNMGSAHNFDTDPLELIVEDGMLRANETTLGADDGVGVVYMMAILEDKTLKHPALECVFTVEEEVGLVGAANFDTKNLKASLCVGLDSSGEDEVYVSSSGGARGHLVKPVKQIHKEAEGFKLEIRGLHGGHSGGDIHLERGNALKLVGIILKRASDRFEINISNLQGGLKINAITREADVVFTTDNQEEFKTWFETVTHELKIQYEISDANLEFNLVPQKVETILNCDDSQAIIDVLFMLPYGVIQKSMAIEDLTITSANIGTANLKEDTFEIDVSLRATQSFVIENIMAQVAWISKQTGFEVTYSSKYPGWNYEKNSKFRSRLFEVHEKLRNTKMTEVATHGGVELGIWKGKMPHLDIIGLGPKMYDIHTPKERLDIASFERTYEVLTALLETLDNY